MSSIRTSFFWALTQNYVVLACQFVASMAIARLLTPAEMGVFSVAVVIVTLAHVLRDFGVGDYIVQEKQLTRDRIRAALTVNVGLGWLLAAALYAGSWPAAAFYRDAGVQVVMQILCLNFLLLPFGSIAFSVLRREMNFSVMAEVKIASALAGSATSILLAYQGMSYLSMAWGSVVSNVLVVLVTLRHRPDGLPFLPGFRDMKRVLSFGGYSSTTYILWELDRSAADLLIGRLLGMGATGIFGRAQGLVQLVDRILMNSVWQVASPYFAQKDRESKGVIEGFLAAAGYMTAFVWPFAILLGCMAYPTTRILFGPQWDASVPLVRWLCLSLMIGAPFALVGSVTLAVGQIRLLTSGVSATVVCKIALLLLGATLGLDYVGMAVVASSAVSAVVWFTLLRKAIGLRVIPLAVATWRSALVAGCSGVGPLLVYFLMPIGPDHLWAPLGVSVATAFVGWIGSVILVPHALKTELERGWRRLTHRRHNRTEE